MIDRIEARRCSLILMLAGSLALSACETVQTTQAGAVGVDRRQTMLLSSEQVNNGAVSAYKETLQGAAQKSALNRDAAQVARVRAVAQRLIPATGAFRNDAPGWKWEVNVISSPEVNAWCMPGGKIAVYTGIIEKLKLTDDELAAIIGHEIAHALREHGRERASQQTAQGLAVGVIGAAVGLGSVGQDLAGLVADVTIGLPYSREFEREADRIGVELAARGGFDPRSAIALWQKMAQASSGGPPQFLSTHPSDESRIKDLQAYSARVMPLYEASRRR
jgi:Zn-dependent protease with chaperone function